MKRSLNGKWEFKKQDDNVWKNAIVPGCNFLDLMNNGDIPDPFIALNEREVEWVGNENWIYRKSFDISENELLYNDVLINCKMLDTICDVYINDILIFCGDNCFKEYSYSVKDRLHIGENEIKIIFYSPVNFVKNEYKRCITPPNSNGQNGIVHIRKPQCHFGWDWGPVLPASGITKDIELEFVEGAKLDYLAVTQHFDGENAVISVNADITAFADYECEIKVICPDATELKCSGDSAVFDIEKPELWWTYELSGKNAQPLYTVSATLICNGKTVDSTAKKIGIRKIELNRELDEYGKNFQFKLNGVPLFIKGASYIPPDSFITRFDKERLNYLLDAAQFSNMNMIRIWGGGYYESDEFYNACDERGILVWQDFQFACQAYPFFEDKFLDNVKAEVKCNVKRLAHHPSLALWCGNNEIEDMHMSWVHMTKYVDWTEKFFYGILENEIRKYDEQTPYTQGSPIGISHNKGVSSDNVGDTHLWGVWHGLKPMNYYRTRMTRFCSEFGFESLPDMKAIEQFADKSDYSLSSDVFRAHQKCANGNDKMIYYIASRFNLPVNFRDYVYLSQVTQNECIADATEHWRRNKGRCNGSMYWQFNDCWGVCSWSSLDYYGNYKALQYGARHFNAPLSISADNRRDNIAVYVLNDYNEAKRVCARYYIFDFENGLLEQENALLKVDAVKNIKVFDIDVQNLAKRYDLKKTGVMLELYLDGELINYKTVLFDREKKLKLPKTKLKTKIEILDDRLEITVTADKFARLVRIESTKSSHAFSDNFFDLMPEQSKTVTISADSKMSLRELAESIFVYSLTDIKFDKNPIKSLANQLKIYTSPVNIGNAVYHGKPVKDVKLD